MSTGDAFSGIAYFSSTFIGKSQHIWIHMDLMVPKYNVGCISELLQWQTMRISKVFWTETQGIATDWKRSDRQVNARLWWVETYLDLNHIVGSLDSPRSGFHQLQVPISLPLGYLELAFRQHVIGLVMTWPEGWGHLIPTCININTAALFSHIKDTTPTHV